MDIREILALEANTTSIKKIDEFLSAIAPNHRDYPKALSHLAFLSFQLGDIKGAFQLLFNYLEVCIDKEKPTVYNTLIKIYYIQKDYNNVLTMIEAKKKFLPNYNKIAYYEDLITYYDTLEDSSELIRTILIYLNDDINDERRLRALIRLCKEYLELEDYIRFNEKNKLVQSLSLSLAEDKIFQESRYLEAYVLIKESSYPKALFIIDEMLEINLDKEMKGKLLALKLEVLVGLGEYRKASIFEAEFEMSVMESSLDAKIDFCLTCIKLYDILNNRFNKNSYEERYQAFLEEKERLPQKEQKSKKKQKANKQLIELNFLKKEDKIQPIIQRENKEINVVNQIKRDKATLIESSGQLETIAATFRKLNSQIFSQFRDYLRQFFISLEKIAHFTEAYFLSKNNKYYGYHYKKERLYEKKTETINLQNTVLLDVIDSDEEIIISDSIKSDYTCIISGKNYSQMDNANIISFPLLSGAVMFSSPNDNILTDKLNYETLKLAVAYLEIKWSSEQSELHLLKKYHDYSFIMEHLIFGYKKQIDSYVYLSKETCQMFSTQEAISIDEFYTFIKPADLIGYRKVINDLLTGKTKEAKARYISEKNGKEVYYEEDFIIDEDGVILSVIKDITNLHKEEENALVMAHYDPISGVYNKSKLTFDLTELIKINKFSLMIFNVIGFKNYSEIYGYDFTDQLIFAIGKYLKEFDDNYRIYHLDGDKFVVVIFNANDKRAMIKEANKIANYLSERLKKLNYRLNINFEVGILRYPTDTNESDPNKLIDYLMSALTCAHNNTISTSVACYSKEEYKKQFFQSQLITHVSEAIDNNHLALFYQQVVDVGSNSCDHYFVSLNLTNYAVSEEMIYDILKRRHMITSIQRYMIHKALFELSEMYKETKLYFNLSFKVSKETLLDETFKDYLLEQLKFFNIPKTAISICYNDEMTDKVYEVLKSLAINQILIASSNLEILRQFPLYYFYYKLPKDIKNIENEFIKVIKEHCDKRMVRFVLNDVNNKELIAHFIQYGINLYSGKVYSALLSSKDIIKSFMV